jgi:transcriptional regulator with GAF, ATPase, and Fis domain
MAFAQIANECEADGLTPRNGERIANELAKVFNVKATEVGILRVDKTLLVFVYPPKLHNVGSIPLNTTGSVAARTATTKRAEVINNFAQTKHTSIFEAVELESKPKEIGKEHDHTAHMIQKLMSAPVVSGTGTVGVIQVCRKGAAAPSAGADFNAQDLQKLVAVAGALAKCFKEPAAKT